MGKRLLIENAYESWAMAIIHHNEIRDGLFTLEYKKDFVSSLHSATELFLKQRMLDTNDHDVVLKNKNSYLHLQYNNSSNLNSFFLKLSSTDRESFKSISYDNLISKNQDLFKDFYLKNPSELTVITSGLRLLQKLRNKETHFYIDDDFLAESEFLELHNFMISFYALLSENELLPYFGTPPSEYTKLYFSQAPLSCFLYKNSLISSTRTKEIIKVLNGQYGGGYLEPYSIAKELLYDFGPFSNSNYLRDDKYHEIVSCLSSLIKFNILDFEHSEEECECEDQIIKERLSKFIFKL